MPPRRRSTASSSLTPENLEKLAASLAEGRRATVYLIEPTPSLGLPEGTSAKVVSISGTTLTIRPKGVDDELPFEADELRITRNVPDSPPKSAPQAAPKASAPRAKPSGSTVPKPVPTERAEPVTRSAPATPPTVQPAAVRSPVEKPVTPKPAARRGKKGPESVSVTIHAGADNDWSVTVTHGARRPGKAKPVTPESVSRAVEELGDATAAHAVEAIISHAREEAAQRVAELRRQLEEAQSTLAALEGGHR